MIDFGGLGIGDRSVDLLYAWSLLDAPARDLLRITSGADEATWSRARAWAFVGPGLVTIASHCHSMPARTERLSSMIDTIAAEVGDRSVDRNLEPPVGIEPTTYSLRVNRSTD